MAAPPVRPAPAAPAAPVRLRVTVQGVVQGVGFRPFVHTLATSLGLSGHVANHAGGVIAEVEGDPHRVEEFCAGLTAQAPPLAAVDRVLGERLPPLGTRGFTIRPSRKGSGRTLIPPDTAACDDCLRESADPADRRYRHPFATCTHCGPRFTIVTELPYDRPATTMAAFPMCPDCAAEYADPADRRFHAQPLSCHACGPQLSLTAPGRLDAHGAAALAAARRLLAAGAVLAVKGIGGYHLACDAADPRAVGALRARKERGGKPFAVMAADEQTAALLGRLGAAETAELTSGRRPIVLLRRRAGAPIAEEVCPGSPDIGVMLPYTPLHRLLFGLPGDPAGPRVLVMTSANRSGEPITTDDGEAAGLLGTLADARLGHDRAIRVPCDDSVVRVRADGTGVPLRRSRGYTPAPLTLPFAVPPALAVGGDLKNVFCLAEGTSAWLSQHIGDMGELATEAAFENALAHLRTLTGVRPALLAADRHPRYRSARWAKRWAAGRPVHLVQHHHAHIASAMAEAGLDGGAPVIGIAFDGTGYGDDGAVWGGEVLLADYCGFRRLAHLAYTPLPGGDAAVRNPYRMALSWLRTAGLGRTADLPCAAACPPHELDLLARQLERGLQCVPTSSMGRLFDAVSSLAGVCHRSGYEAQAAIELEAAAVPAMDDCGSPYSFAVGRGLLDPAPVLRAVVADLRRGTPAAVIAARFHHAVAGAVLAACRDAAAETGVRTAALSGGVFANALLDQACAAALRGAGFTVLRHRRVPPGDGGLALGQLAVAARAAAPRKEGPCASQCPGR